MLQMWKNQDNGHSLIVGTADGDNRLKTVNDGRPAGNSANNDVTVPALLGITTTLSKMDWR